MSLTEAIKVGLWFHNTELMLQSQLAAGQPCRALRPGLRIDLNVECRKGDAGSAFSAMAESDSITEEGISRRAPCTGHWPGLEKSASFLLVRAIKAADRRRLGCWPGRPRVLIALCF